MSTGLTDRYYLRFPEPGAAKDAVITFRDRWFNYQSTYRCGHMARMAMNLHYILGRQWIDLDSSVLVDGVRGYIFKDLHSDEIDFPRPVTNYLIPTLEVEMASLAKRELVATVVPTSRDPRIVAAARVAKEILDARLRDLRWAELRDQAVFLNIACGTVGMRSFWDESFQDTVTVAAPGAVVCHNCRQPLASAKIPLDLKDTGEMFNLESAESEMDDMGEALNLRHCPSCQGPIPLQPYTPSPEEAASSTDRFSRRLGMEVPRGNTGIEVISPFELFPENSGIQVTPDTMRICGQASVRSIDWVEDHYPEWVDKITPDDPYELMRYHPILGEWNLLGRFTPALDSCIFDNHVRVYILTAQPSFRFPNGRIIVVIGDEVVEDGDLVRVVPTQAGNVRVHMTKFAASRFKQHPGEFWGDALMDNLISPQNRINGIDAQVIEARERMGSPNLLVPEEVALQGPEWYEGYGSGKIMKYQMSPMNPQAAPTAFGSMLMPQGVMEERQLAINDMRAIAGPQDIEIGEAPRNVSTTTGLQLLGESAERKRSPRERSMITMYEQIWKHQLDLLWALRAETAEFELEAPDGTWDVKQFDRMAIAGQTKVKIEKQAYVDVGIFTREGTREAQADGLYRLDSQAAIKKLLEYRNLPTDVNEDLNLQVDRATQQWVDFKDNGTVPVIDPTLHDPVIRSQTLGALLLGSDGREMEEAVDWPTLVKQIAGWEQQLSQMEMMEQQVIQTYGGRLPQDQADKQYAQLMIMYQQQKVTFEQQQQQEMMAAQASIAAGIPPNPPQGMPPLPPPPPVYLPAAIEDKIFLAYMQAMKVNGVFPPAPESGMEGQNIEAMSGLPSLQGMQSEPPPPPPGPESLPQEVQNFLKFRAVLDGYRALIQKNAMGGAPTLPAGVPTGVGTNANGTTAPPNPPAPPVAPGVGGQQPV